MLSQIKLIFSFLLIFSLVLYPVKIHAKTPIFGLHDVININNPDEAPPKRPDYSIDYKTEDIKVFLEYLLKNNYKFLTTDEFYKKEIQNQKINKNKINKKEIMLTFDDGYKGLYTNLLPILKELSKKYKKKVKVVLFITVGLMGNELEALKYISCEELREGFKEGYFDVQSHGYTHRNFTELNEKELEFEMKESQSYLRKCLESDSVAKYLAYPFGAENQKVREVASKYFLSAYSYNNKYYEASKDFDKFRIPRLYVSKNNSPKELINKL